MFSLLFAVACAGPMSAEHVVFRGGTVVGHGVADVVIREGRIVSVGQGTAPKTVDVTGKWLVPAFIDSHVHLAYLPDAEGMADGGIAAAVDMAAPQRFLGRGGPIEVRRSGPMVTAVGGYPTRSWGRDGYGRECADEAEAVAAVDALVADGAALIKTAITDGPSLDDAVLAAVVTRAHEKDRKVAVHALTDETAARGAAAGVDVLAHTPVTSLSEATVQAWSGRVVVSSLRAFGGPDAVDNLRALRDAGATVLYGTDFGNTRTPGIDRVEILGLQQAGLDGAAIVASGTSGPADYWGFDDLGRIAEGKQASLLVLGSDPLVDPQALARPEQVWIRGVKR